jgi:hypothetical protein
LFKCWLQILICDPDKLYSLDELKDRSLQGWWFYYLICPIIERFKWSSMI